MRSYDGKTSTETESTSTGHQRKTDPVCNANGQHDPLHLCFGNGRRFHPWTVGQGGGQRRNIQNDFTRFFYSYRRHDWIPEWYQTNAK